MMKQQYLHELLRREQEPFHLNDYISDRKNLLKRDENFIQIKKLKPNSKQSLRNRSPEARRSLQIPATTAALLMEAAARIQGAETRIGKCGLGLFGSVLRRFKERNCERKLREIKEVEDRSEPELRFSGGFNRSSGGWSESNEEKSLDLEASSNFEEEDDEVMNSPFRFSLVRCSSSGHQTPEFSSPATSPRLHKIQENKENCKNEELENPKQAGEENKEQCSPVSVLDHRFEDDDYIQDEEEEEEEEEEDDDDDYDLERDYSTLQKAQQELLYKLQRFEQLAELDPFELEKIMLEESEAEEEDDAEDNEEDNNESVADRCKANNKKRLIRCRDGEIYPYTTIMKCVNSEEKTKNNNDDHNRLVWRRDYNRLDFCETEFEEFKNRRREEAEEIAAEIEVVMFGALVEELSQELWGS